MTVELPRKKSARCSSSTISTGALGQAKAMTAPSAGRAAKALKVTPAMVEGFQPDLIGDIQGICCLNTERINIDENR